MRYGKIVLLAALTVLLGATAVLASEGAGGGEHHLNWTDLIYRAINFAILAGAVFFLARKPLSSALKSRSEGIKEELAELEKMREEARRDYALMEQRVKDAAGEREAILAEFRAQGEREKEKILGNAQGLAERIKQQAQFTIEQETSQARADLRREVAELSAQVAEDMLKQNISGDDQTRLVDEYLTKVQQEVQ